MLALVKTPHTEISINGDAAEAILNYLREKFPVEILVPSTEDDNGTVNVFETDWYKEEQYLKLMGLRLKMEMTQEMLAEKSGIAQSVISMYESGKRKLTLSAAMKLAPVLGVKPERLLPRKRK